MAGSNAIAEEKKIKLQGISLNSVLGRTLEWLSPTQILIAVRTKAQLNPILVPKEVPTGPVVQESGGVVSQNRTYPDLIRTDRDEKIFAQAIEQQLLIYDIRSKKKTLLGKPGLYGRIAPSPSGKQLMVDTFLRPFSKVVPLSLYAKKTEIWDLKANVVHAFKPVGPFENLPIEGVPVGIRSIRWIESEPETVVYAEALDQGNWEVKVDHRDALFKLKVVSNAKTKLKPPSKPELILKLRHRFAGFQCFREANHYFISEYERDRQCITDFLVKKENDGSWSSKTLFSRNENDAYGDPGDPVLIKNEFGRAVIAVDETVPHKTAPHKGNSPKPALYLSGSGASPDGNRPFLRRFEIETQQTEELFRSVSGSHERFLGFKDETFKEFITSYESKKESPRFLIRSIGAKNPKLLYADPNPYQILSRIKKEVITYERADGVKLSGVLYYPIDYQLGKKYPAIIQAYPLEYTDAATAGQVRGSPDTFSIPYHEDMIYNALRGYFVLDEAQMPIIGHPETKNDTFIEQLVAGAKAAVDTLVERGLVDQKRIGVVGHSYGAYMVANLLTHSDLFATGIAKSGAYNRTLTPFGFQGERRPLWKAKDVYLKMSPFLAVDQLKKPILLIHGMADNNSGTFPIQSERYFDALKGQGVNARLVLLPEESHGYASIESVEHVLHEIFSWFDRYLLGKN